MKLEKKLSIILFVINKFNAPWETFIASEFVNMQRRLLHLHHEKLLICRGVIRHAPHKQVNHCCQQVNYVLLHCTNRSIIIGNRSIIIAPHKQVTYYWQQVNYYCQLLLPRTNRLIIIVNYYCSAQIGQLFAFKGR